MKNQPSTPFQRFPLKVTSSILGIGITIIAGTGYYLWNAHQEGERTNQVCRQAISLKGEPAAIQKAVNEFLVTYDADDFEKTEEGEKGIPRSKITKLFNGSRIAERCVLNAVTNQVPNVMLDDGKTDLLVGKVTATNAVLRQFYPHTTFFDAGTQPSSPAPVIWQQQKAY